MNERNSKSMDADLESIELDEPERVEHLRELDVGDKIVWDDFSEPRTVVQLGVREKGREDDADAHVETPMARIQGPRGKTHVLAHRIRNYEEQDAIVAVEEGRLSEAGKVPAVAIVRTHIGGSRTRVGGNTEVVA